MTRMRTLLVATVALSAAAGALAPAWGAPTRAKASKGTWSYTDVTPDPTYVKNISDASSHCHGQLPAAPSDVNSHRLKVTGRGGTLTVAAHVIGDWALEIRNAKGVVVAGDDQNPPATEGATLALKKGTYAVVLCNLEGGPTATADYTFKPR
jgi:hypothetical protein